MPEFFSDELKDFLKKMMVKNYLERMRLNDAVRHPFISKHFSKKEENFFN